MNKYKNCNKKEKDKVSKQIIISIKVYFVQNISFTFQSTFNKLLLIRKENVSSN